MVAMALFGLMVMRDLTPEQQAQLDALLATFGAPVASAATIPMPTGAPAPAASNALNGEIVSGDVSVEWLDGVPQKATDLTNPNRWAWVPASFWQAVQSYVPEGLRVPFVYLAFLESDYVATAKNPSPLEESWGVMQVNRKAWPQYSVSELSTYSGNLVAGVAIYNLQGFGAWYNSARRLGLI